MANTPTTTSADSSGGNSSMMYILDEGDFSSFGVPDLLQQAMADCDVDVSNGSSSTTHHDAQQDLDIDLSRLLQSPNSSNGSTSINVVSGGGVSSANSHDRQLFEQIDNLNSDSLASTVKVVTSTIAQPQQQQSSLQQQIVQVGSHHQQLKSVPNNIVTVFNGGDGSLSLSLETARSLGLDVGDPTPGTSSTNNTLVAHQVTVAAPAAAGLAPNQSVMVNGASLLPSTLADGTVAYILRSAPPVTWAATTSILKPGQLIEPGKPTVNFIQPMTNATNLIVSNTGGHHITNNAGVLTSVLRPVMATGIVTNTVRPPRRHQPMILPKIAPNPGTIPRPPTAVASTSASQKKTNVKILKTNTTSKQPTAKYIITSSSNKSIGLAPGSSQNPIRLVQEGSMLHSSQPLTNTQVTEIARMIKENTQRDGPSAVVCDNGPNAPRIVYKIVYPEDVLPPAKRTVLSGDTSDEDSYGESDSPPPVLPKEQVFTPEELSRMRPQGASSAIAPGRLPHHLFKGRKRGRPRGEEAILSALKAAEGHAKKLRAEFGLTGSQAVKLEKDIVDDRLMQLSSSHQNDDDDQDEKVVGGVSRTRSGRMSRPPTQLDDADYHYTSRPHLPPPPPPPPIVPTTSTGFSLPEVTSSPPRPKRKLSVPPRFRCRVCQKTYLGDRKMNRHIKLFPTHGPCEEPPPILKDDGAKKMAALTSVPIIPLARTQLEELVKNLDAELVLDVVSKKMFDNFSMWQLQLKKMSQSKDKGLKVIDRLFQDTELVLTELKRLVDNCLTDTKLCDDPCPSICMGEYLQLALSGHDGPWYLEKANHIPEEYHQPLGLEPSVIVSPRSESNTTEMTLHDGGDDDNSNSMMSAASEPPRQMVLKMETNLGARPRMEDMDDDSQDFASSSKKRHDDDEDDDIKADDTMSPMSQEEDEDDDEEISVLTNANQGSKSGETNNSVPTSSSSTSLTLESSVVSVGHVSGELAMEIDSLNNPHRHNTTEDNLKDNVTSGHGNNLFVRTRLPSFSSIINSSDLIASGSTASSTAVTVAATTSSCSSDSLLSVLRATTSGLDHLTEVDNGHHMVGHLVADQDAASEHEADGSGDPSSRLHSRRSSIDAGRLVIHESLPGSRHVSPVVSRRTSVDHGGVTSATAAMLLQRLSEHTSSALSSNSGLNMMSDDGASVDISLPSHLFSGNHHHTHDGHGDLRLSGSDPPTPAGGLHPMVMEQSTSGLERHYHSMPNSPRPRVTSNDVNDTSLNFLTGKSTVMSENHLLSMGIKTDVSSDVMGGHDLMHQLTIHAADMDTSTNVTFTDHQPIVSLSPVKSSHPDDSDIMKSPLQISSASTRSTSMAASSQTPSSGALSLPPPLPSQPTPVLPHSGASQDSSSSVSHFFGDLESVLADSADYLFGSSSLKTPEKCFYAISPRMAMAGGGGSAGTSTGSVNKKSNDDCSNTPLPSTIASSSSGSVRIDFLGAIEKEMNRSSQSTSDKPIGNFTNTASQSSLTHHHTVTAHHGGVTPTHLHEPSTSSSAAFSAVMTSPPPPPPPRDSLSSLFFDEQERTSAGAEDQPKL